LDFGLKKLGVLAKRVRQDMELGVRNYSLHGRRFLIKKPQRTQIAQRKTLKN